MAYIHDFMGLDDDMAFGVLDHHGPPEPSRMLKSEMRVIVPGSASPLHVRGYRPDGVMVLQSESFRLFLWDRRNAPVEVDCHMAFGPGLIRD